MNIAESVFCVVWTSLDLIPHDTVAEDPALPSVSLIATRQGIPRRFFFSYESPRLSQNDPVGLRTRLSSAQMAERLKMNWL